MYHWLPNTRVWRWSGFLVMVSFVLVFIISLSCLGFRVSILFFACIFEVWSKDSGEYLKYKFKKYIFYRFFFSSCVSLYLPSLHWMPVAVSLVRWTVTCVGWFLIFIRGLSAETEVILKFLPLEGIVMLFNLKSKGFFFTRLLFYYCVQREKKTLMHSFIDHHHVFCLLMVLGFWVLFYWHLVFSITRTK